MVKGPALFEFEQWNAIVSQTSSLGGGTFVSTENLFILFLNPKFTFSGNRPLLALEMIPTTTILLNLPAVSYKWQIITTSFLQPATLAQHMLLKLFMTLDAIKTCSF